jgi:hypothetical protein
VGAAAFSVMPGRRPSRRCLRGESDRRCGG